MYDLVVETLILVTVFSGVPMAILALVSGLVAFLQTVTQIQEQSVVHFVRFIAFVVVIFVWGNAALGEVEALFSRVVETSAQVMRVEGRWSVPESRGDTTRPGALGQPTVTEKGVKRAPQAKTLKGEKGV